MTTLRHVSTSGGGWPYRKLSRPPPSAGMLAICGMIQRPVLAIICI